MKICHVTFYEIKTHYYNANLNKTKMVQLMDSKQYVIN